MKDGQNKDVAIEMEVLPEPVYTLAQVAKELQLSHERTRKLFEREPGVIVIAGPGEGTGYSGGRKRSKARNTYRVPRSVVLRVLNRMKNVPDIKLRECA